MARSYDAWMVGGLATMAIIYNTNISYAHDTTRACLSLLCLGLCQSVERLSASNVDIDDGCSLHSIRSYDLKAFLSFNCKHCTFHYDLCLHS